ncbi:DUF6773 family protein [Clostridium sp. WILCCON 0269]|uniref:DUF6773 family protein n=1 Tax=Candidatus Clostridium eludens TaxID=3381663 RepID=A0ABW8SRD0_9CLOT
MKDERIEQATNKINSELALLMYGIVVISFLAKLWIYNIDLSRCWTEYIIMIIVPLYQFIRARSMKVSLHVNKSSNLSFKVVAMQCVVLVAIFGAFVYKTIIQRNNFHWKSAVFNILIFIVLFVFIYFVVNKSEKKQVKKYEEQFNDDEK